MSKQTSPSKGAMRAAKAYLNPSGAGAHAIIDLALIIDRESGLAECVLAMMKVADEWDDNEIGQIDGDSIDALRAAISKVTGTP